jgi:putative phage-type endonuclease
MNATERKEWLEARRNGIGSSDVPAVLGMSPWKTALSVYVSKTEPASDDDGMTGPQEWGHRAEPMIAGAIIDKYGWKLEKPPTLRHPQFDFLIASPDRANQDGDLIEIKTASRSLDWGEPETAEIPTHYFLQVQHQLEVADRDVCWVCVLIGGNDFRRYMVPRDRAYLATVIDPLQEFWQRVLDRNPPEPDWSHPSALAAVNRLCEPKSGTFTVLPSETLNVVDEYERCGVLKKEAEQRQAELKAKLIFDLGDFETGLLTDGREVVRKMVTRKAHEVKESTFPQLNIRKGKVRS